MWNDMKKKGGKRKLRWHFIYTHYPTQSNLNSSSNDGSFIMANSNSFLSPNEIPLVAQENKYIVIFLFFIMKLYVCTLHTIIVQKIDNTSIIAICFQIWHHG